MRIKHIIFIGYSAIFLAAIQISCTLAVTKPTPKNFIMPVVSLSHVEVEHYWGWWFFSKKIKPTKGKAGDYGAPLYLAFIFEIQNPNKFPVMLEKFQFMVGFEEFDINTVSSTETMWIPAGKTNQIRVHSLSDARQALLSLLVTGGFKLKEKGISPWEALEKWWTGVPEFSFPVYIRNGSAIFRADGIMKGAAFKSRFP